MADKNNWWLLLVLTLIAIAIPAIVILFEEFAVIVLIIAAVIAVLFGWLLGHSSIATTEIIYTHVSDEALRVTLERADVLGALGP
jgi:sugar phosphate permease